MARPAIPSTTLAAAVRAWLGLTQAELAGLLGVTRGQVAHVEAGRHLFSLAAGLRLRQLALCLPPPLGVAPPVPEILKPIDAAPDPGPLRTRLRRVRHEAAALRRAVEAGQAAQARALHRQQAGAALAAALPPGPEGDGARRVLADLLAGADDASNPAAVAAHQVRALRLAALEAEAAALSEALSGL